MSKPRGPVVHVLKTEPVPFRGLWAQRKRHEVRRFDRDYRVGDTLKLREYDPNGGHYSGRYVVAEVLWVTDPGTWGLPDDVGVLSIAEQGRGTDSGA